MLRTALELAAGAGDADTGSSWLETVVTSAAGALVGLVAGILAFPIKWLVEWLTARRSRHVTACRDAHRLIRTAELNIKYEGRRSGAATVAPSEINWFTAERRAWDEAEDIVDQLGGGIANCFGIVADLWRRSYVVPHVYRHGEEDDPGPAIRDHALELLTYRIQHPWGLPDHATQLATWERQIRDAEVEAEAQERQMTSQSSGGN
jgi:hypothetical protein